MNTVIVLRGEGMGEGDAALGARLIGSFLRTLTQLETRPDTVIFYNSAVRLLAAGSSHLDALRQLEAAGVDLLACVTCLEHYSLVERLGVGSVSNMREIATRMLSADKVISV